MQNMWLQTVYVKFINNLLKVHYKKHLKFFLYTSELD